MLGKIIFVCLLLSNILGCVSISSTPYPEEWPRRVSSENACLDVSGRYVLPRKRPETILHLLFDEQAELLEIVQDDCSSIRVISKTGAEEVVNERTLSLKSAGLDEIHVRAPPEASFIFGVSSFNYIASMDSDGSLLLQYQSFAVGLGLFVVPVLVNNKGEWEKYMDYDLARANLIKGAGEWK